MKVFEVKRNILTSFRHGRNRVFYVGEEGLVKSHLGGVGLPGTKFSVARPNTI